MGGVLPVDVKILPSLPAGHASHSELSQVRPPSALTKRDTASAGRLLQGHAVVREECKDHDGKALTAV